MFEILSTIGLTASASIVIGFLAYAMARDAARAPDGRRRSHRLVRRSCSRSARAARSIPFADLAFPLSASRSGCRSRRSFAPSSPSDRFGRPCMADALPALVAMNAIRILPGDCLCFSTPRADCPRRSRRAQAGATFSPASPPCRSPGRLRDSARASRRSFLRGTSSGSQISSTRSRLAPCRRPVRFRLSPARRRAPS